MEIKIAKVTLPLLQLSSVVFMNKIRTFIIGAFLTPPDAISQTLLAVPMWMLFELGLLCSRLFARKADDAGMETRLNIIEKQDD